MRETLCYPKQGQSSPPPLSLSFSPPPPPLISSLSRLGNFRQKGGKGRGGVSDTSTLLPPLPPLYLLLCRNTVQQSGPTAKTKRALLSYLQELYLKGIGSSERADSWRSMEIAQVENIFYVEFVLFRTMS